MKLVVLVRMDLKLPKGKLAVQVAHAAVDCVLKSDRRLVDAWKKDAAKKVVLKVEGEKDLFDYQERARDAKLKSALISDAGRTTVAPGTITCLGIGPDEEGKIDALTKDLKIL